jgi:3-deoxy-D-manno-octulosonate 8-phosphate phosphatase (KDO 8-P phosphatase)
VARARKIRVLLMDVDGVMTDGRVYLQSFPSGEALELKAFHSQDGAGLQLARIAGLRTGVITGRESAAMTRRARENGMEFVYQGRSEKTASYEEILRRAQATDAEVAFVADDLPDLQVLRRVGLAVAVANAVPEIKAVAHLVTKRPGGEGAVREVIEFILKAQGKWLSAVPKARA